MPVERAEAAGPQDRPAQAAPAEPQERVVLDFLNNVREMVTAQRDVMLGFLGQAAPAGVVASAHPPSLREAAPDVSESAVRTECPPWSTTH